MWRAALNGAARGLRAARSARTATGGALALHARTLHSDAQSAVSSGLAKAGGIFLAAAAASVAMAPTAHAGSVAEKSFIMIKPDGVQRGLVADIIKRFESKGYQLVAIKVIVPSQDIAKQHYAEHDGKPFFPGLVRFLTSGPVVAMVWEGKEVIKTGRALIGSTNPLASAPGTIRGDYGIDVGRNIIHGSDGVDSAQKEIALWFRADELAQYEKSVKGWIYESAL